MLKYKRRLKKNYFFTKDNFKKELLEAVNI